MKLVLDASAALSWFFKDQRVERSVRALRYTAENGALVPPLWSIEGAHVRVKYERRGFLTQTRSAKICDYLRGLPITVDTPSEEPIFSTLSYARTYQIPAYDAAYLDLPVRFGLRLATLDDRLEAAARSLGALWVPRKLSRRSSSTN